MSELRAHLGEWLDRARSGAEVVITDRGLPIARLLGISTPATLQRLATNGVTGQVVSVRRPVASGRLRPRARSLLSDIIGEQRA
jgi:prevent-host-death family protein